MLFYLWCQQPSKTTVVTDLLIHPFWEGRGFRGQRGFALLIVLLILTIMISVTTTVAYSVASQSLAASSAVASFQNRLAIDAVVDLIRSQWQSGQIQTSLLEKGHVQGLVEFTDHVVVYRLSDEATKIRVLQNQPFDVRSVLRDDFVDISLKQTPFTSEDETSPSLLFEDVFNVSLWKLGQFYGELNDTPSVSDVVTLWGDGRVNLFTAPEEVIRLSFGDQSQTVVESIIAARRFSRTSDLERLIDLMGLSSYARRLVEIRLTDRTSFMAMRVACHGPVLRTDAFLVWDVQGEQPSVVLWRDMPAGKNDPKGTIQAYSLERVQL